jgi:hypothetical protein
MSIPEGDMLERIRRQQERDATKSIGAAAIAYGVLLFLSNLFSEFLLPAETSGGEITRLGIFLVYVGAYGAGAVALALALRALDGTWRVRGKIARAGSIGLRVAAAGAALQALFALLYFATAAATGDATETLFLLFALGFLLLIGGSVATSISMIRRGSERGIGALLFLTGAAASVTILSPAPVHDTAIFLYAVVWIAIGLALVRRSARESARQRVLGLSSAVALLIALSVPAVAFAGDVETIHFGGAFAQPSANPCSGAPGTTSVTFMGVSHTNVTPVGGLHHTATVTGETVFTPDDPREPTYSGRFTAWDGQNGAVGATITSTATFHDTLFGSDGSKIRSRGVFHVTQLADGTVTAALETFSLACAT